MREGDVRSNIKYYKPLPDYLTVQHQRYSSEIALVAIPLVMGIFAH